MNRLNIAADRATVAPSIPPSSAIDVRPLELAQGDMDVARTFLDAADNFIEGVRAFVAPDGIWPNPDLLGEILKAQTMFSETHVRLVAIDDRVSATIKQIVAVQGV